MPRKTKAEWVEQGKAAIVALLEREHAAAWPAEIIAKIADRPRPDSVDPHHLTSAVNELLFERTIETVEARTRGGGTLSVLALTDRTGRQRAFEDAAARKRLLYSRYLNWSSRYYGRAGERVVHASLSVAAPQAGYRLFEPRQGQIRSIFGHRLTGPLDNGGTLQLIDARGRPTGSVSVLVEVKNVHHWIYSSSAELYQLLAKAAHLQEVFPDEGFVPVLVCRRGHPTTFRMAKDLGFFVADARAQYVLPVADVSEEHVTELRTELGMIDLVRPVVDPRFPDRWGPYESKRLVKLFAEDLPSIAERSAERFKRAASLFRLFAPALRDARPGRPQSTLMAQFRRAAYAESLRSTGAGW